jgi:hypothetical protein
MLYLPNGVIQPTPSSDNLYLIQQIGNVWPFTLTTGGNVEIYTGGFALETLRVRIIENHQTWGPTWNTATESSPSKFMGITAWFSTTPWGQAQNYKLPGVEQCLCLTPPPSFVSAKESLHRRLSPYFDITWAGFNFAFNDLANYFTFSAAWNQTALYAAPGTYYLNLLNRTATPVYYSLVLG